MSTGNKKSSRKPKRASEKDHRMAQLKKEIARLEEENSKLQRDSVEYENRLAAFAGPTRYATNFPPFSNVLQTVADNRNALKFQRTFRDTLQSGVNSKVNDEPPKKKLRIKTGLSSKKRDTKK
ncbi:hypothetical protein WN55_00526 [Dufourea novaeangliae]|uniref:Uncharacterized protein n=1 Tax=Dufourea novaeangliae TaxID=178035 RepID=A0A154PF72_DUFNO|nr:hypothetical protein WN55_00526 [Dufourea novaeangliae]